MITLKIRIYPNRNQRDLIDKILWELKCYHNFLLDCINDAYNLGINCFYGSYPLNKFSEFFDFKYSHSQMIQQVEKRLTDAYKSFFKKIRGHPKYKSIRKFRSFTYPQSSGFKIQNKGIRLGKFGKQLVKAKLDTYQMNLINFGKSKTLSVKKYSSGKYYAFLTIDVTNSQFPTGRTHSVGVDPGIEKFVTLSDGNYVKRPKFLKKFEKRINRAQRKLSRKVGSRKGERKSNNFKKQQIRLAKLYEKIRDTRRDHHFKVAHWLVNNYQTIYIEDLQTSFMINKKKRKSKSLTKLAMDIALSSFIEILNYMSIKYNTNLIKVPPHNTTQNCSHCGVTVPKSLSDRVHSCPHCGFVCDRDINAALNILIKGSKGCCTVGPTGSIRLVEVDVSGH